MKTFLVIIYNKKISESLTIRKLNSCSYNEEIKLIIHNNGPDKIDWKELETEIQNNKIKYTYSECLSNRSLSEIYNDFSQDLDEGIVILDDDSCLTQNYIDDIMGISNLYIVAIPKISVLGEDYSPRFSNGKINNNTYVSAPMSGIYISKSVISKLSHIYGGVFDERFTFYGVDATFLLRIKLAQFNSSIRLISGFEHSISGFELETPKKKAFRKNELSKSFAMKLKYYFSFYLFLRLIKAMAQGIYGSSPYDLRLVMKKIIKREK